LLQVKQISRFFGGLIALEDVSLEIKEGELVGLMGPNGAGKTTLFNIINNFIPPTKGSVYFKGEEITGLPPHEITKKGLVRTFQNVRVFEHLDVLENVEVAVPENERIECLKIVGLSHLARRSSSSLTFGQQRLLGIARALACRPQILLLDEPSAGLNKYETMALFKVIQEIHAKKVAIFIIEHDIGMLMDLAQKIIVLDKGRKIMEGTPDEVKGEEKVLEAYFGRKKKCLV